ncbi:hypothetical protein BD413DRAFT_521097 [Trametes elegans]|nr:hypothetical protein BD413DRAFT_521097 [Trametes elegans]
MVATAFATSVGTSSAICERHNRKSCSWTEPASLVSSCWNGMGKRQVIQTFRRLTPRRTPPKATFSTKIVLSWTSQHMETQHCTPMASGPVFTTPVHTAQTPHGDLGFLVQFSIDHRTHTYSRGPHDQLVGCRNAPRPGGRRAWRGSDGEAEQRGRS